jgi:hypothetical protein
MADYVEASSTKKMPAWKSAIFVATVFALVSLPFTRRTLERTIPALQDNNVLYLATVTVIMYVAALLIIQGSN